MRTIIDIPEEQLVALSDYCRSLNISRAEAVRRAIARMIETEAADFEVAFGSWKDHDESTDEYLARVRGEWDR